MRNLLYIILNSFVLGTSMCLISSNLRRTVPVLVFLTVIVTLANGIGLGDPINSSKFYKSLSSKIIWWCAFVFMGYFLTRQFIENTILLTDDILPPIYCAAIVLVQNFCLIWILCTILIWSRRTDYVSGFLALLLGFAVYAGLNLGLDPFFPQPVHEFGESRFEGMQRWSPPLARSNALLAMGCTVVFGTSLYMFFKWKDTGLPKVQRWLLCFSMLLPAICSIRCQFRAHLFTAAVACGLLLVRGPKLLRVAMVLAFSAMILFPTLFLGNIGSGIMENLPLEDFLHAIGSKSGDITTLSGRTDIYTYAWQRLSEPVVALFGEGPALRDASRGIAGNFLNPNAAARYRMPYHSTCMDSLMQHGLVIGGLLLLSFLFLGLRVLSKRGGRVNPAMAGFLMVPGVMLTLWFFISIMDGALGAIDNIVIFVFVGLGAISWQETHRVAMPSSAVLVNTRRRASTAAGKLRRRWT